MMVYERDDRWSSTIATRRAKATRACRRRRWRY